MASNRAVGRSFKSPGSGRRKASVLIGIFLLFIAIAGIVIGRDGENKQKLDALVDSVKPAGEPVEFFRYMSSRHMRMRHRGLPLLDWYVVG